MRQYDTEGERITNVECIEERIEHVLNIDYVKLPDKRVNINLHFERFMK